MFRYRMKGMNKTELINPECEKNQGETLNPYLLSEILGDPGSDIQ